MKIASQNEVPIEAFVTCKSCGGPVILATTGRPRVHAYCDTPQCRKVAAAARARAHRAGKRLPPLDPPPIRITSSVVHGNNAHLIREVAHHYLIDGAIVADVTFGQGVFWRQLGRTRFRLIGSDIRALPSVDVVADFRQLPYADASIDVVVLDPPYVHIGPNGHYMDDRYGGASTTPCCSHQQIIARYRDGLIEARRVLRPHGQVWVKTMDEIESGLQRMSHIEVHDIAVRLGLKVRDLFLLVGHKAASGALRWRRQKHARKAHSYLWVFEQRGSGK
jgi:hypothetical protein